jgi:subtilisin family serine protease
MSRHPARLSFVAAVVLLGGTLSLPASAGAAEAGRAIIAEAPAGGPTVDLLIGARSGRIAGVAALAASFGPRDKGAIRGLAVRRLRVPAASAAALELALGTDPSVGYVEVDGTARATLAPDDPYYTNGAEWGLPLIGAPAAWDTTTGDGGPVIAVIDTGVSATHPELAGRVLPGIDLVNGDNDPSDDNGHGTHVAGIAAATGNNTAGVAGVCWGCRILPVKALDASGSGAYSTLASAITWATDHGASIINMSLGGASNSTTLGTAVAYAQSHGVVVIAAAGNSGVTTRFYPAAFSGVVAVGAVDQNQLRYSFSNFGTDWVDVAAGGCTESTWPGSSYASLCGTSMATPFVSGSLGLLLAADPAASAAQAEAALESTAGPVGTDWTTHGLVHLDQAMTALLTAVPPDPTPDPSASPDPSPTATPAPTASPTPTPAATPTPTPTPTVAPLVVTRSVSLAKVPISIIAVTRSGSGRISLSNPRHARLVVTLRRAGAIVWQRTTRVGSIYWTVSLRTATYTLTVSHPGYHVAHGTVSFRYHRR